MREAIGSSLLFNIVLTIVIIMIAFLIGSLAYSKAFKVKNRIIDIIVKNEDYNDAAKKEINDMLSEVGYRKQKLNSQTKCSSDSLVDRGGYDYCVYRKTSSNNDGNYYYKVVTYMYFDIPVIGRLLTFPVSGETKVIYDTYIDEE